MSEYRCVTCDAPMVVDHQIDEGVWCYRCSAGCGATGMRRETEPEPFARKKKPTVLPYDRSPYRGGKLVKE